MRNKFYGIILMLMAFVVPSWGQILMFEAGAGVVSLPFRLTNGCLYQPMPTHATNGGRAVYNFVITNAGDYAIQVRVNAPHPTNNSFYVNIDAEPEDPPWNIVPATVGFENRILSSPGGINKIVPKRFTLNSGNHQLIIRGKGANVQMDRVWIARLPSPPTGVQAGTVPEPSGNSK